MWTIENVRTDLQGQIGLELFYHSLRVAETARDLAKFYDVDHEKAYYAALIHDYAKEMKLDAMAQIADEQELLSCPLERTSTGLLHAPVGAYLVQQAYDIYDAEIIQAINYHTIAGLDMDLLSKIVFMADKIEPGRNYPDHKHLFQLTFKNIDEAILFSVDLNIRDCIRRRHKLHPRSNIVRNYLLDTL